MTLQFAYDNKFVDKVSRCPHIQFIKYLPELNYVLVIEGGSQHIHFYTPDLRLQHTLDTAVAIKSVRTDAADTCALRAIYIARVRARRFYPQSPAHKLLA